MLQQAMNKLQADTTIEGQSIAVIEQRTPSKLKKKKEYKVRFRGKDTSCNDSLNSSIEASPRSIED